MNLFFDNIATVCRALMTSSHSMMRNHSLQKSSAYSAIKSNTLNIPYYPIPTPPITRGGEAAVGFIGKTFTRRPPRGMRSESVPPHRGATGHSPLLLHPQQTALHCRGRSV